MLVPAALVILICVSRRAESVNESSYYTSHFDNGGLIYPSDALAKTVTLMEDAFTSFFSKSRLHEDSLHEFAQSL